MSSYPSLGVRMWHKALWFRPRLKLPTRGKPGVSLLWLPTIPHELADGSQASPRLVVLLPPSSTRGTIRRGGFRPRLESPFSLYSFWVASDSVVQPRLCPRHGFHATPPGTSASVSRRGYVEAMSRVRGAIAKRLDRLPSFYWNAAAVGQRHPASGRASRGRRRTLDGLELPLPGGRLPGQRLVPHGGGARNRPSHGWRTARMKPPCAEEKLAASFSRGRENARHCRSLLCTILDILGVEGLGDDSSASPTPRVAWLMSNEPPHACLSRPRTLLLARLFGSFQLQEVIFRAHVGRRFGLRC